jgi:hypothetical protein
MHGNIKISDKIIEAAETKYDKLVKLDKWKKLSKPKEDRNLIILMATIKNFMDSLSGASKSVSARNSNQQQPAGEGQVPWK